MSQIFKIFIFHVLLTFSYHFAKGQDLKTISADSSGAYIEIYGMGSTNGYTPFWLQSNQFGTISKFGRTGTIRGGIQKYWNASTDKEKLDGLSYGIGAEVVGNLNRESAFILPQLNGSIRYKNWELFVGRKNQMVGLADSTLGTGSYAWSTNALPIPKIQIGTVKFISFPFTKDWIAFNGFYSDGFFEKNRPVTTKLKLHHKALYIRIGKETSRLKLFGGFNHQVQWGGKSPYLTDEENNLPNGFKNYLNVVTGKIGGVGESVTHFDSTSRVGNHLGSIDVAVEIESYQLSWRIYRQFIYEDGSLFYLQAVKDGLNGISIRRKNFYGSNFSIIEGVVEFLYTKDQGGDDFIIGDGKKRGRDNYFNNQQVRDGWSYFDRTIGTPFIPPSSDTKWKYPSYADNHTSNNRVMVIHLGMNGTIFQKIYWHTKLSFSNNSGAYLQPIYPAAKQFSGIIGLQTKLNWLGGSIAKGSLAVDNGTLYRNNIGFSLGLRKNFTIN